MISIHNEGKSVVSERFIRTLKTKIYKYMTLVSKKVFIIKLNDIVGEYSNTHRTIKMKLIDIQDNTYIDFKKEVNDKDPKFKVDDHVRIFKYKNKKKVFIIKLNDIVGEYSNTHRTIKMKLIDIQDNTYIDFKKEVNDKDPKFKVDDHVRIFKYKNIFAKGYTPNWFEEVFIVSKIKNNVPWTRVINDFNDEEITGTFYEKELQTTNQKEFRIEELGEKVINCMSKVMIIHLIAGLIKKI